MRRRRHTDLPERRQTLRQRLREGLEAMPSSARDLAALVGLDEHDVVEHLEHLERSLRHEARLVVDPAECVSCGYRFVRRARLGKPSRCPRCRSERIEPPRFRIEPR